MDIYAEWKYLVLKNRGGLSFTLTIPNNLTISQNTWSKRSAASSLFF